MATIIIALLQKNTRERRIQNNGEPCEEFIQFRLYRILSDDDAHLAKTTGRRLYAKSLERCATSGAYINLREVTKRLRVAPGNYLIIPSCYDSGISGQFLLRLYTEHPINEGNCLILNDHKDNLDQDDVFFSVPKSLDDAFNSWTNLLIDGATKKDQDLQTRSATNTKSNQYSSIQTSRYIKQIVASKDEDLEIKIDAKKGPKNIRRFF